MSDNGLRDETGALIGGLNAMEYQAGFVDFNEGKPPPDFTTASYDLGRQLGARRQEEAREQAALLARLDAESDAATLRIAAMLPEIERQAFLAKIWRKT